MSAEFVTHLLHCSRKAALPQSRLLLDDWQQLLANLLCKPLKRNTACLHRLLVNQMLLAAILLCRPMRRSNVCVHK
jgi:hypothetical protein